MSSPESIFYKKLEDFYLKCPHSICFPGSLEEALKVSNESSGAPRSPKYEEHGVVSRLEESRVSYDSKDFLRLFSCLQEEYVEY